jgi:hypothetical protein
VPPSAAHPVPRSRRCHPRQFQNADYAPRERIHFSIHGSRVPQGEFSTRRHLKQNGPSRADAYPTTDHTAPPRPVTGGTRLRGTMMRINGMCGTLRCLDWEGAESLRCRAGRRQSQGERAAPLGASIRRRTPTALGPAQWARRFATSINDDAVCSGRGAVTASTGRSRRGSSPTGGNRSWRRARRMYSDEAGQSWPCLS